MRDQLAKVEQEIRAGRVREARVLIRELAGGRPARQFREDLSRLAWRCDLPEIGIRLLNPIVRPAARKPMEATDGERAEYAVCLINIGARVEAMELLGCLDGEACPKVHLYRSFGYFSHWAYREAIPELEKFVRAEDISDYQRLVGRANLAAALVFLRRHREADVLLSELKEESKENDAKFLEGILLELGAISLVEQEQWEEAENQLTAAFERLHGSGSYFEFFVRKWKAIVVLRRGDADGVVQLSKIRAEAHQRGHWETVRQCDEYQALAQGDTRLFRHVFFGTAHRRFRERLVEEFGGQPLPERYVWYPGGEGETFDLFNYGGKRDWDLKPGQLLYRLLSVLCSDFYRALPVAAIHHFVYPGEYYSPTCSSAKVYEAVKRLRLWFRDNEMPFDVAEEAGSYRLVALKPAGVLLAHTVERRDRHSVYLGILKERWDGGEFSLREACEELGMSYRTTHRVLEAIRSQGKLIRIGKSRSTRYVFPEDWAQAG